MVLLDSANWSDKIALEILQASYYEHFKYAEELFRTGREEKAEQVVGDYNKINAQIQLIKEKYSL